MVATGTPRSIFAPEGIFIERVLVGLLGQSPGIGVVLEYIRTEPRQPSCRPVPSGSP
jgi:hypothetical protein